MKDEHLNFTNHFLAMVRYEMHNCLTFLYDNSFKRLETMNKFKNMLMSFFFQTEHSSSVQHMIYYIIYRAQLDPIKKSRGNFTSQNGGTITNDEELWH